MNDIEFLGYKETPGDKYGMLGFATLRATLSNGKKIILRYKKVKSKNGGEFFCSASFCVEEMGEKKYKKTNVLDSPTDDEMLMEYIEDCVKKTMKSQSAFISSSGGDSSEELPF